MKLLLAYDGSRCAESAIDDLCQAGLPETGDALLIAVAEVWLPPRDAIAEPALPYIDDIVRAHLERSEKELEEAWSQARQAVARLRITLPGWTVTSLATYGSPAWEILSASDEFDADLIVVGSHGQSALSRFFLGSISQKVLTEARCSVRVARGKNQIDPAPARIVVGFDGSRGSSAAVDAVVARRWNEGSEVRLVAATEEITPSAITRFVAPVAKMVEEVNITEQHWIDHLAGPALEKLRQIGVEASIHIHNGNPKDIIVEEAESWGADSIFVGANAYGSRLQRAILGSTSAAVAARAHCSVEVVRVRPPNNAASNGKLRDQN